MIWFKPEACQKFLHYWVGERKQRLNGLHEALTLYVKVQFRPLFSKYEVKCSMWMLVVALFSALSPWHLFLKLSFSDLGCCLVFLFLFLPATTGSCFTCPSFSRERESGIFFTSCLLVALPHVLLSAKNVKMQDFQLKYSDMSTYHGSVWTNHCFCI